MTPAPPPAPAAALRQRAGLLLGLLLLFCGRVLGQMVVAFTPFGGALPPMEAWYSGLMPYAALLPCQWAIILVYGLICRDFWRGHGRFVRPHRPTARWLTVFAWGYLGVMLTRYVLRMTLHPHERWTGGSLPIFFHWVLASFLIVVAHYHARHAPPPRLRPWVRGVAVALGVPLYGAWIFYFVAPHALGWHLQVPAGPYAVRVDSGQEAVMDDGTILRAEVFHPQHLERTPTILVRIPHGNKPDQRMGMGLAGRFWAEHGYTVVVQGVRGRGTSDGEYVPFEHERDDGLATLRWLAGQPWYNGSVGTWGGSYFGYTQWSIADQPAVRAMIMQEASADFYDMLYPGGAFSLESALNWATGNRPHRDDDTPKEELARGYVGLPLAEADARSGHRCAFYQSWVGHPTHDAYWQRWSAVPQRDASQAKMLYMAGWFDPFLPSELRDYAACLPRGAAEHLIIGPWCHACSVPQPGGVRPLHYRFESLAPSVAFFDHALAGQPDRLPPVRYYLLGANAWREADRWPPTGTEAQRLFLHGASRSLDATPAAEGDTLAYTYDPQHPVPSEGGAVIGLAAALRNKAAEGLPEPSKIPPRDDLLVFRGEPLAEPLDLVGPQAVELGVVSDAPCTEFVATLSDEWPDGRVFPYSQGALQVSQATAPQRVRLELWPIALRLAAGHRLHLRISSSSHPRFAAHPNVCGPAGALTAVATARQILRLNQSSLTLSVLREDS